MANIKVKIVKDLFEQILVGTKPKTINRCLCEMAEVDVNSVNAISTYNKVKKKMVSKIKRLKNSRNVAKLESFLNSTFVLSRKSNKREHDSEDDVQAKKLRTKIESCSLANVNLHNKWQEVKDNNKMKTTVIKRLNQKIKRQEGTICRLRGMIRHACFREEKG